ncbi:MAG: hypothetical protein GXY85_07480 [Candidatus Brocadiaceae bacterium]|nr:hypothetical protein [Candidatus Brocadiaceae bacterium]
MPGREAIDGPFFGHPAPPIMGYPKCGRETDIGTRRNAGTVLWLAVGFALCGCTVRGTGSITANGRLDSTPPGPCPVLQVTIPQDTSISARGMDWGVVRTQNPDVRFAEILAHSAREDAGLDVPPPFKMAGALKAAGLPTGLQPDPALLQEAVRAAGCASFLSAELIRWQCSYVFVTAAATIEFRLTCYDAADGRELWNVHVFRRAPRLTDGEVARLACTEAFRRLKDNAPADPTPPAEDASP